MESSNKNRFTKEQIDTILSEISGFSITLEDDPTLPHLGSKYLQKVVSQCRNYLNRVSYYYQLISRMERETLRELKILEMDLDFKTKEKLADDQIVRQQPSIEDRKALAASILKNEHDSVNQLQIELLDIQESKKIIKFIHSELQRTNQDIRVQRSLVKDDKESLLLSGGYRKPQADQDKFTSDGLPPVVDYSTIEVNDVVDDSVMPDVPIEPVPGINPYQISNFLIGKTSPEQHSEKLHTNGMKLTGMNCDDCGSPAWIAGGSGISCDNGHGAPFYVGINISESDYEKARKDNEIEPKPKPEFSYDDLL